MLDDKLSFRTGIDTQYLNMVIILLNLDKDPDYIAMEKDFQQALALVKKNGIERGR